MDKSTSARRKAQKLARDGEIARAIEEMRLLVGDAGTDPYDHVYLGDLLMRAGRPQEALDAWMKAVHSYDGAGLNRNAIAVGKKLLRLDQSRVAVHRILGELYCREGLHSEAMPHFLLWLDTASRQDRLSEEFLSTLDRAAAAVGLQAESALRLGEHYLRVGRSDRAACMLYGLADKVQAAGSPELATELRERACAAELVAPEAEAEEGAKSDATPVDGAGGDFLFDVGTPAASTHADAPPKGTLSDSAPGSPRTAEARDVPADSSIDPAGPLNPPPFSEGPAGEPSGSLSAEPATELPAGPVNETASEPLHADPRGCVLLPSSDLPRETALPQDADLPGDSILSQDFFLDPDTGPPPDSEVEARDGGRTAPEEMPSAETTTSMPVVSNRDEIVSAAHGVSIPGEPGLAAASAGTVGPIGSTGPHTDSVPDDGEEKIWDLDEEEAALRVDLGAGQDPGATVASGETEVTTGAAGAASDGPAARTRTRPAPAAGESDPESSRDAVDTESSESEPFSLPWGPALRALIERAESAFDAGRWTEARGFYDRAAHEAPLEPTVLQRLVEIARRLDDPAAEVHYLEQLGDAWIEAGVLEEALETFLAVIRIDPDSNTARRRLSRFREMGVPGADRIPEATRESVQGVLETAGAQLSVRDDPGSAIQCDEWIDLGALLDEFREGIKNQIAGDDAPGHYDLAVSHHGMGLFEEAVDELDFVFACPNLSAEMELRARELRGNCLLALQRYREAVHEFRTALEQPVPDQESRCSLLYHLGLALESAEEWREAAETFERVQGEKPGFLDVEARLAACGLRANRIDPEARAA